MAWIQVIGPDGADGQLRDVYREIASARGGIANVHQAQSLNARALRAHLEPRVSCKVCAPWVSMTKPFSMRRSPWRTSHSSTG